MELSSSEGVIFKRKRGVIAILDFQRVKWIERGQVVGWAAGSVREEWQLLEEPTRWEPKRKAGSEKVPWCLSQAGQADSQLCGQELGRRVRLHIPAPSLPPGTGSASKQ